MIDVPEKRDALASVFSLRFTPTSDGAEEAFMEKLRQVAAAPLKANLPRGKIQVTPMKDAKTGELHPEAKDYKLFMDIMPGFDVMREGKEAEETRVLRDTIRARTLLEMGLKETGLNKYLIEGPSL